ncbi:MAG: hypothetical protein RIB47_01540 [Cyclobacteriaceae bacterium]
MEGQQERSRHKKTCFSIALGARRGFMGLWSGKQTRNVVGDHTDLELKTKKLVAIYFGYF